MKKRDCQSCGAPLPEHSGKCEYCGTTHDQNVSFNAHSYRPVAGVSNAVNFRALTSGYYTSYRTNSW